MVAPGKRSADRVRRAQNKSPGGATGDGIKVLSPLQGSKRTIFFTPGCAALARGYYRLPLRGRKRAVPSVSPVGYSQGFRPLGLPVNLGRGAALRPKLAGGGSPRNSDRLNFKSRQRRPV